MEDPSDGGGGGGGATAAAGETSSADGSPAAVAAVASPAAAAARLSLPGVMDAEGRVDESRLRMHIFKNGTSEHTAHNEAHNGVFYRLPR